MKVILIEERQFKNLLEVFEGRRVKFQLLLRDNQTLDAELRLKLSCQIDDLHRAFHYEFVKWAQEEGAKCV